MKKIFKKILRKIKTRTWIALAIIAVLSPIGILLLNRIEAAPTPPAAYWKLDEGVDNTCSGGVNDACDSANNGNDAAQTSATWQSEDMCISGKCLYFDGSTSSLSAADSATLSQTSSFTISAWIKPQDTTAATFFPIAGKWDGTYQDYLLTLYGDEVRMYIGSSSNYESTDAVNLQNNTWYHVQAAYNASAQTVTIYVNGNAVDSTTTGTIPASITDNTGAFDIGYSSAGGTVSLQVNANDNDGSSTSVDGVWHSYGQYDNSYGNTGMFPLGGEEGDSNSITTGLRFTNVTIPQGTTISAGTLDFKESYGGSYGTNVKNKIYAAAQDDCSIFGASNLPSSMTKTTQSVDWDSNGSQGSAGSWYQASATVPPPDISDIVYEVINRPGWVSGNDICILIENDAGGSTADWWFEVDPYESGAANAAKLDISFTTSNPGGHFNGFIDEVKVFGAVLSESQIKTEAVGGAAIFGAKDTDPLTQGLSGYWKLDEASGDATDSSGNGLTLTNGGTTTYVTGKYGHGSEHVPASSQYLSTATTISGVKTVSFWVNPDSTTNYYASLTSSAYITSSSGTISATGFTNPTIYVNGVISSTIVADSWQLVTVTTDTAINANQFYLGRQSTNYFDGTLDEVRVYNRTLSPAEVSKLYNWSPGPVGYWPMDENTGQYVFDKSGSGATGTLGDFNTVEADDPGWDIGRFGSATTYNGSTSNKNIEIADDNDLDLNTYTSLTIMAWVKRTGNAEFTNPMIVAQKNFIGNASYTLMLAAGSGCGLSGTAGTSTCFQVTDGTDTYTIQTSGTGVTADSTWHHVAAVFDRAIESNMRIYIDGVAQNITTSGTLSSIGSAANSAPLCIGIGNGGTDCWDQNEFNGSIDELKMYNYARTPGQIIEDMNGGHPTGGSPISTETIYWKFDEMQGTTANDTAQHQNGTVDSNTTWSGPTSCKINGCLLFNAAAEEVSIATASDEDVDFNGTESFSGSVWIYPTAIPASNTPRDAIIAKWDETSSQRAYRLSIANESADLDSAAGIEVEVYDESANQSLTVTGPLNAISVNNWYHITFTFNGGTAGAAGDLKLYMNGQLVGQNSVNASFLGIEDVTSDFTVGEYDPTDVVATNTNFQGYIDEVKLYSSALTPEQVRIDMNANSVANFGTGTNEAEDLTDGAGNPPVAHWKIDENTGTSITDDLSGNGYTLSMNGSMTTNDWVPGKYGSALDLDGSNDFLSNASYIQPDVMTASAWAKFPTNPSGSERWAIITNRNGAYDYSYILMLDGVLGTVRFITMRTGAAGGYGIAETTISGLVDDNKWHFYAGTYDGTYVKLYVDGKLMDTTSDPSATLYNANNSTYIGRNYDGSTTTYTPMLVDDAKIYDYARTSQQIAYDYNRGAPIAWYKLDECTGTTIYDSAKTANGDATGNNGTWSGASGTNTSAGTCSSGTGTEAWDNGTVGKFNSSLDFDGTDDIVTINPDFRADNLEQLTVTAWIYPDSFGENSLGRIADKNQVLSGGWAFYLDSGGFCGGSNQFAFHHYWTTGPSARGTWCATSNTISTGEWQHIAVTYDDSSTSNDASFYVNGELVGSSELDTPSGTTGDDSSIELTLGNRTAANRPFDGRLDDIRIYNYQLSADQIKKVMNEGSAVRFGPDTGSP